MPAGAPTRARPATPAKIADRSAQWRTGPTYPYPSASRGRSSRSWRSSSCLDCHSSRGAATQRPDKGERLLRADSVEKVGFRTLRVFSRDGVRIGFSRQNTTRGAVLLLKARGPISAGPSASGEKKLLRNWPDGEFFDSIGRLLTRQTVRDAGFGVTGPCQPPTTPRSRRRLR
jgi:hypothetical protein